MSVPARLLSILAIIAGVSPLYAGQSVAPEIISTARGKALFNGAEPLSGRIREHPGAMPPAVVTCSNCHAGHQRPPVPGSDAPTLSASFLTDRRSRRHGPLSAYDNRTFCRVLRTGIDPVYVLVDHTMPLYEVSDSQCQSLWRFLLQPDSADVPGRPH